MVSNPIATRDAVATAHKNAERAQAEATQATQEAEARKVAAQQAARDARDQQAAFERELRGWTLRAGDEIRKLAANVDAVLKDTTSTTSRPAVELRALARQWLYGLVDADPLQLFERLCSADERLGQLIGESRQCGAAIVRTGELNDASITAALDDLECRCWAAGMQRVRFLAGEVE
jgi:hypothetical protein